MLSKNNNGKEEYINITSIRKEVLQMIKNTMVFKNVENEILKSFVNESLDEINYKI
ncbi:hypothetical protein [Thiospirochaeta perfilievii]|uniref:hypothetical protein n=1 Tax=Thiospirochaeta perfilievii TaxID=252967 RepID=UPI001658DE25|nr:hypothetical protein [Thiospirochaeta perfilievii]